jgi:phosphoglycerate kinase
LLAEAQANGKALLLPEDHVVASELSESVRGEPCGAAAIPDGKMGLDIGPRTVMAYSAQIARARLIVWNGPLGVFELPQFQAGTFAIARAVAAATDSGAVSVVGGGDSVAAVNQAGAAARISHISTGGGASLEFLEGKTLPGIAVLTDA